MGMGTTELCTLAANGLSGVGPLITMYSIDPVSIWVGPYCRGHFAVPYSGVNQDFLSRLLKFSHKTPVTEVLIDARMLMQFASCLSMKWVGKNTWSSPSSVRINGSSELKRTATIDSLSHYRSGFRSNKFSWTSSFFNKPFNWSITGNKHYGTICVYTFISDRTGGRSNLAGCLQMKRSMPLTGVMPIGRICWLFM